MRIFDQVLQLSGIYAGQSVVCTCVVHEWSPIFEAAMCACVFAATMISCHACAILFESYE